MSSRRRDRGGKAAPAEGSASRGKGRGARGAAREAGLREAVTQPTRPRPARLLRAALRLVLLAVALGLGWIALYAVLPPPTTPYILAERARLGRPVERVWVPMEDIAPVMARAAVAAEDANFCAHWGFDMAAIRKALAEGAGRGASTISQQVVKNAFLWHGRSWPRKALEAAMTPPLELIWSKRRILEVYLNIAEFGPGIFGVEAAARRFFNVPAAELSADQAARLAAVLPNPKERRAADLPAPLLRRARMIRDGAATIRADGRAACFQG